MKIVHSLYSLIFSLLISLLFLLSISPSFVQAQTITPTSVFCTTSITRDLKMGDKGSDVIALQIILNMSPDTTLATTGDGSPGQETTRFGSLTKNAVIRFQEKYAAEILAPQNLTNGTGYVGASTRKKLSDVCLEHVDTATPINTVNPQVATTSQNTTTTTDTGMFSLNSASVHNAWVASKHQKTIATTTKPIATTTPISGNLAWGVFNGYSPTDLTNFENLVGKPANIFAVFMGFGDTVPLSFTNSIGAKGKTLLVFWEPQFGYDQINNGGEDNAIKAFAASAKTYGYTILLAPFNEMNINEENWGYSINGNTAAKFKAAWIHIHDLFLGVTNVKFVIAYNNESVPDISGNRFSDYYPGSAYVDYVGVDGFNFGNPWESFSQVFDNAVQQLNSFGKPIYILSTASAAGTGKAAWITQGLGTSIKGYSNVLGWVWFNENKEQNWLVNSDPASLTAFEGVLP